jgi:hypothetical protein
MLAIDIKNIGLKNIQLRELRMINPLEEYLPLDLMRNLKIHNKGLQPQNRLLGRNVRPINHTGLHLVLGAALIGQWNGGY